MLRWRLAISAVLVPALFGLFWCDHRIGQRAWILLAIAVALALRACWELVDLLQVRNLKPGDRVPAILSVAVIAAGWWPHAVPAASSSVETGAAWIGVALLLSLLILFFTAILRYQEPGRSMESLSAEWLAVAYCGGLLAMTAQLRWVAGAGAGYLVLGSVLIAVKGGDIGAYTLGRLFGRRKMAPRLSPGKTWAGAVGAILFSSLGTWAFLLVATPQFHPEWRPPAPGWCVVYGAILGLVGLIGDLSESLIKRDVGRKDAAALMPGFGGLLDLIDSVVYAGPVAWILWRVFPLATWQ